MASLLNANLSCVGRSNLTFNSKDPAGFEELYRAFTSKIDYGSLQPNLDKSKEPEIEIESSRHNSFNSSKSISSNSNNVLPKIDILVFGDDGVGKRTFMEQFTNKRVLKNTRSSKTCKTEYVRKIVSIPGKQQMMINLWR